MLIVGYLLNEGALLEALLLSSVKLVTISLLKFNYIQLLK